jgi:hypothetical protein
VFIDVSRLRQGSLASRAASQANVLYPAIWTHPSSTMMLLPRPMNAAASRNSPFFHNKPKGTSVERAPQLPNNKKSPPIHQVSVPTNTKQSARYTVDLLALPVPTIDILDDGDTSIAPMESLSLQEKILKRNT